MAIGVSALTLGSSSTNTTTYNTASITPTANRLVLLAIEMARSGTAAPPAVFTVTGNGLTWVEVAKVGVGFSSGANYNGQVSLFRAMGASPSAGAVQIVTDATATSMAWSIVEFSGIDTSGTNGSGAIVQSVTNRNDSVTTVTATLGTFSNANNATYGAFGAGDGGGVPRTWTPGTGFTELHDTGAEFASIGTMWQAANDTTVDSTASASTNIGAIAVEIAAAPVALAPPPWRNIYLPFLVR